MSSSAPAETSSKRCLYDVLGVSRDASPDEIRAAYRKLALRLHPDKVGASTSHAAATAAFQELVNAYDVLSDPKERSYYDSHRSQIIFSSSSSSSKPFSSFFDFDLFSFFSSSAFSGFSDSGRGFFKVYGDLFDKIYQQEAKFQKQMGLPSDTVTPAPVIGNLDSPYAQVTAFYGYWIGFCTVMDFAWADVYDAAAGVNRKSRRVMEGDNKKARRKARKEYNDCVRGLAEFAKKRDKRVVDMVKNRREEEERRRVAERERKKEEERRRKDSARAYEEPKWARIDDDEGFEEDGEDGGRKGSDGGELLYCVVCCKKFKSEKQWKNHEQSRKHKDKVTELRDALLDEEEEDEEANEGDDVKEEDGEVNKDDGHKEDGGASKDDGHKEDGGASKDDGGGDEEEEGACMSPSNVPEVVDDATDKLCEKFDDRLRIEEEEDGTMASGLGSQYDEEESILEAMVSGHKSRKDVSKDQSNVSSNEVIHGHDDSEEDSSMTYDNRKKGGRNRAKRKGGKDNAVESVLKRDTNKSARNGNWLEHEEVGAKDMASSSHLGDVNGRSNASDHASGKNQKSKKLQFDERGASKGKKNKGPSKPNNLCEMCGEIFESRNKLFMHLGETGHVMLKSR